MFPNKAQKEIRETWQALQFVFTGPLILLFLFAINWMTSPGNWWVQWVALGIGIAWVVSLLRVLKAILVVGGLAAFAAYLSRRNAI
jgi:hypothetical protein